jgi:CheY-like chemotaxis protein
MASSSSTTKTTGFVDIADVDGAGLVRETLDAVALAARDGEVKVNAHVDPALAHLRTDGVKLRQCVLNLLSNAVKFTRGGTVRVDAVRDGDLVRIIVEDTGIGMTAEQVSRLFQPFVQASSSTSRTFGGTGLGLAITRRLAMLLGGDVGVRSAPGQGSRFELTISARFGETISTNDPMPSGPYVLVIEDAADARDLIARAAAAMGFQTCGVSRGGDGLAHARARRPSLIVLDIGLPDGSGWSVLQTLKGDPKTKSIPVLVHSVHDDRATSIGLGACEHLVKPTERAILASAIARYATSPDEREAVGPVSSAAA